MSPDSYAFKFLRLFLLVIVASLFLSKEVSWVPSNFFENGVVPTVSELTVRITAARTLIFTFDSRDFATAGSEGLASLPGLTAALNLWYARRLGASFAAYHAPPQEWPARRESPVCSNSLLHVVRAGAWCKLLAVWSALKSPETQRYDNFVFIDSDAVFLRENVSVVERHISTLHTPGAPPLGFLWHHPQNHMPSTGYFFFTRKNGTSSDSLDTFLTRWWNFELPVHDLAFPWGGTETLLQATWTQSSYPTPPSTPTLNPRPPHTSPTPGASGAACLDGQQRLGVPFPAHS